MLKTILSVSGKPGLFKLISNGKNMVIVESLADKRRIPIYARDKVVSLGDIAMYTDNDEVPLGDILLTIETKENGGQTSVASSAKPEELRKYFAEILPDYDRDRVHDSDIKKLISWYNLLINSGYSFKAEKEEENTEKEGSNVPEEKETAPKEDKNKEKATKKEATEPKKKTTKTKKEKE